MFNNKISFLKNYEKYFLLEKILALSNEYKRAFFV